jgi:hypothetical protein
MKGFFLFPLLLSALILSVSGCNQPVPEKEIYIWSHNDYEQPEPLVKALRLGAQMIEADIHLIDGELRVIHDHPENPEEVPGLIEQYVQPLAEIIEENNGAVLPESTLPFYLVIDVKTEAESTFSVLMEKLEPYNEYFTRIEDGAWTEGPVRLLISGNRPQLSAEEANRMAFIDGRIPDIGEEYSSELYPVISDNWNTYFSWDGTGEMPGEEWEQLNRFAEDVHAEGKLIRFWATPDREEVWEVLLKAGVDIINVDDLEGVRDFLDRVYY